jgi:PAS domain S-box-containing protein
MVEASDISPIVAAGGDPTFRLFFDPNPLPMLAFDDDTLSFVAVNDAAVEKYGWSREEFLGMTVEDLWVPEDLPIFRGYRDEKRDESSSGLNQAVSWRHRTRDGKIFSVDSSWHTMPFHGRNAVLLVMIDLTEQKRAEERSQEQASLLDLAADAIMVRGLDQRVLFWNQGAERLYGWTKAEAVGALIRELFPNEAERLAAAETEFLERGVWTGEIEQTNKEGRTVVVSSRWTLVRDDDGAPKSALVINTDITETKKLESQFLRAQRLEAIGTLASGIAHDLNNILSPILMSVGILRRSITEPDSERMLSIIESSAERGAGIVKQVLTLPGAWKASACCCSRSIFSGSWGKSWPRLSRGI